VVRIARNDTAVVANHLESSSVDLGVDQHLERVPLGRRRVRISRVVVVRVMVRMLTVAMT
jgi:hypothetical protein